MSDILVQYDNRTRTVKPLLVRLLSSKCNEETLDLEDHKMGPEDSTAPRPPGRCPKWSTLISVAFIAALTGFIAGGVVFAYKRNPQAAGTTHNGRASSLTGNIEINSGGMDLRNNVNNASVCEGPACMVCREQVSAPNVLEEGDPCLHSDPNIRDSYCYSCNGCKPLDILQDEYNKSNQISRLPCGGGPPRELLCCTIAEMGNLGNFCGVGGQYKCYRDENGKDQPKCKCPPGKTGDRCQESNTEELKCRCYNPAYKFCGQEDMIECHSKDRGPSVTQCHMEVDRNEKRYNCLCNKMDNDDSSDNDLDSCSVPHTDRNTQDKNSQPNDSANLFQSFTLCIVSLVISLVDKT